MSINHAILGILSCKPMSGYDIKKVMQESVFMHWSGNNNQIYKALTELLDEGYVTGEVIHQENSPSKKIYTISDEGRGELRSWAGSSPEPDEFRNTFLVQLAFADVLEDAELDGLLARYEDEIGLQLLMNREKIRRGSGFTPRSPREALLWQTVDENVLSVYQNELRWIREVRDRLAKFGNAGEAEKMKYSLKKSKNGSYIEVLSCAEPLRTEQDALGLIALCGENDTNRLMLHAKALSEDFFRLKTGVAGAILQKFVNYSVNTAIVVPDLSRYGARFKELVNETGKGREYRFFTDAAEAESWLMKEELQ